MSRTRSRSERHHVFEGHVWDVVSDRVDLGDGVNVTRDYVAHPGAVVIAALNDDDEVMLVKQYRHPVGRELWELPAGLLDMQGEDPLDGAKRELFEEADLVAETWHVLADAFSSPGGSSEAIRIYLARGLSDVPQHDRFARTEEERDMISRWVPREAILDAIARGRVGSPSTVIGVYALDAALRSEWSTLREPDAPWARPSL